MTKEEILDVQVVEKEKKTKPAVSEDSLLSTFSTAEAKEEQVKEVKTQEIDAESKKVEEVVNSVEPEKDENDIMTSSVEVKNDVVEPVLQEVNDVQETGETVELADNILSSNETNYSQPNNSNLPADLKPYLNMVKEKLMAFGKFALNLFEKIGNYVENLFKKK